MPFSESFRVIIYSSQRGNLNSLNLFLSHHLFSGRSHHAEDDGCHRGRPRVGGRLWIRGYVFVPVQSRSGPTILSHFGFFPLSTNCQSLIRVYGSCSEIAFTVSQKRSLSQIKGIIHKNLHIVKNTRIP